MRDSRQEKISHLVKNWTRFKLGGYPWPNADSIAVDNKVREIFNEMKNSGFYPVDMQHSDSDIDSLIQEARVIVLQS